MLSLLREAGWPIWPLLLTSVLGLAFIFERLLTLRRKRILPPGLMQEVADMARKHQDHSHTLERLERSSPYGRILAEVLRQRHAPHAIRRDAVESVGQAVAHELNRYVPAIGTVAMVAPLMGLFGTVIGMIEIFGSYAPGNTDPTQLAHGISIALYNTGFGILIAIPAMIAHRTLRSRIDAYLNAMEQGAAHLSRLVVKEKSI